MYTFAYLFFLKIGINDRIDEYCNSVANCSALIDNPKVKIISPKETKLLCIGKISS